MLTMCGAILIAAFVLAWQRFAPSDQNLEAPSTPERGRGALQRVIVAQAAPLSVPRVTGKILAAQARPLAGATVCASCSGCDSSQPSTATVCTKSDPDGRYGLQALHAGDYLVSATAQGYRPKVGNGGRAISVPREPGPAREIDIQLDAGGALITGAVVDSAGGPIAQATVHALFATEQLGFGEFVAQTTTSDADGKFALTVQEGMVNLLASADGYADGYARRPAPSADVEIALAPAASLHGTVVAESGEHVAGVRVLAERQFAPPQQGRSDEAGEFTIAALAPGVYSLRAQSEGWIGDYPETIALTIGESVRDVQVVVRKAATIRGVLLSGERTPCAQGRVHLGPVAHDYSVPILEATTNVAGAVTFEAAPPGRYRVSAMCLASDVEPVGMLEVGTSNQAQLVWSLKHRLEIAGRVVDDRGRPVPNVSLELRSETTTQQDAQAGASGTDGAFVFRSLPAGNYLITSNQVAQPVRVSLAEPRGATDVVMVAKPVGEIAVHVVTAQGKALDGLSVTAIAADGMPSNLTDELGNGMYRVGSLLTGSYAVYVSDGVNPRVRAGGRDGLSSVRAGETTRLEVKFGGYAGRITGRVLDGAGAPLENVWVQATSDDANQDPTHFMQEMRIVAEGRRALTDAEGRFELSGLAGDGAYDLKAELPLGGAAKQERVKAGANVDIVMQALATLAGVAVDAKGEPIRHLSVGIRNPQTGQQRMEMVSHPEGRFRIKHVTPGPVQITVSDANANVALASWDLSPGQHLEGVRLELRPMQEQHP